MITKKTIEISQYYDDDGRVLFVLPSGFQGKEIIVTESPVDLEITHLMEGEIAKEMENLESIA